MEIEVKRSRDDDKPLKFNVDVGNNTPEAVAKLNTDGPYGDVVFELFLVGVKQQFRQAVLGWVNEDKLSGAALAGKVKAWRPEVKHRGKPPLQKALAATKGLSSEERDALIKSLQAQA